MTTKRWTAHVTTLAVLAPFPYSLQRVLWAAGIPLGVDRELLDEFHAPGWGSLYILGLVVLIEGTALWTHVFVRSRAVVVPDRVPLLGGRPVKPWLVIAPLLAPIAILAEFNAFTVSVLLGHDEFGTGVPGWSLALQAASFGIWGVALTVATFAYARTTRGPVARDRLRSVSGTRRSAAPNVSQTTNSAGQPTPLRAAVVSRRRERHRRR